MAVRGDAVRDMAVEHHVHRARLDDHLFALPACSPVMPSVTTDFRSPAVSARASSSPISCRRRLFIPLAEIIRSYKLGDTRLPDFPDPFLHMADDGLLQGGAEGAEEARGSAAPRWRRCSISLFPSPSRASFRGNLCLHAILERVHLRARVPVEPRAEDGAIGVTSELIAATIHWVH